MRSIIVTLWTGALKSLCCCERLCSGLLMYPPCVNLLCLYLPTSRFEEERRMVLIHQYLLITESINSSLSRFFFPAFLHGRIKYCFTSEQPSPILSCPCLICSSSGQMVPEIGRRRMEAMLATRTEWCISRQRVWGVPIPVFYDECGKPLLTNISFAHILECFQKHGSDCWYVMELGIHIYIHTYIHTYITYKHIYIYTCSLEMSR